MVQFPQVAEIRLFGAFDRGVPNRERITMRVQGWPVNLAHYLLLLGYRPQGAAALPIPNQSLWLGEIMLNPWTWLHVFTGQGTTTPLVTTQQDSGEPAYVLHWQQGQVLFQNINIVPMLVRVDFVTIDQGPFELQQALPMASVLK